MLNTLEFRKLISLTKIILQIELGDVNDYANLPEAEKDPSIMHNNLPLKKSFPLYIGWLIYFVVVGFLVELLEM